MTLNELIMKLVELQGIYGGDLPITAKQKDGEVYEINNRVFAFKYGDSSNRPANPEQIMIEL